MKIGIYGDMDTPDQFSTMKGFDQMFLTAAELRALWLHMGHDAKDFPKFSARVRRSTGVLFEVDESEYNRLWQEAIANPQ